MSDCRLLSRSKRITSCFYTQVKSVAQFFAQKRQKIPLGASKFECTKVYSDVNSGKPFDFRQLSCGCVFLCVCGGKNFFDEFNRNVSKSVICLKCGLLRNLSNQYSFHKFLQQTNQKEFEWQVGEGYLLTETFIFLKKQIHSVLKEVQET